jgi:lysine 2,3-aminomutase
MSTPARITSRLRTLTRIDELVAAGLVSPDDATVLDEVAERYAVAITPEMAALVALPDDAIARQFVPSSAELSVLPVENPDPIGDHPHSPVKGLVHRYPDRVLIKLTHTCPVYCRFCFRREMVGPAGDGNLSEAELDAAFAYIAKDPAIFEVIFTGGDPLMLSARRIAALGRRLADISHIRVVRWHSRVPVVAPERITTELARAIVFPGKANFVAIHANHAREFSSAAISAIARLADHGVALLGQSVLLKGVNDDTGTLAVLLREMVANRIRPLYLHHPDLAPGTGHFRQSIAEGQALHASLRGRVPGHAIPTYVLDLPGGHGKIDIGAKTIRQTGDNRFSVQDRTGIWHEYEG